MILAIVRYYARIAARHIRLFGYRHKYAEAQDIRRRKLQRDLNIGHDQYKYAYKDYYPTEFHPGCQSLNDFYCYGK